MNPHPGPGPLPWHARPFARGWLAWAVPWLIAVVVGAPARGLANDADAAAKAAQLERLRERIEQTRRALAETRSEHDVVQAQLRKVERRIGQVGRAVRRLARDIQRQEQALASLRQRRAELQEALAGYREILARQVRASYVMGRQEHMKILLNQGDPATVQRALVYYDYLNRSRAAQIRNALARLEELQAVEQEIREKQERLQALLARRAQQKKALEDSRMARQKVMASLERRIDDQGQTLRSMVEAEKELEWVVRTLNQALDDIPLEHEADKAFAKRKGELPWPANGRLMHRFGSRRSVGNMRWRGVVIRATSGRDVRAISYGRVAFADWLRGYGLLLIIDHGDGYMSLYGHNQSLYKDVGEWVESGEVVASVGDSGGQRDSGLYFEIRSQGKPVDPTGWCRAPRGRVVGLNP